MQGDLPVHVEGDALLFFLKKGSGYHKILLCGTERRVFLMVQVIRLSGSLPSRRHSRSRRSRPRRRSFRRLRAPTAAASSEASNNDPLKSKFTAMAKAFPSGDTQHAMIFHRGFS